jgi:hypothetical protein
MTMEEIMAELNRRKEAPVEPQRPEETGSIWQDLKNKWDYVNAQNDYNQQVAESVQNPHTGEMLLGEFHRGRTPRELQLQKLREAIGETHVNERNARDKINSLGWRDDEARRQAMRDGGAESLKTYQSPWDIEQKRVLESKRLNRAEAERADLLERYDNLLSSGPITPQAIMSPDEVSALSSGDVSLSFSRMNPQQHQELISQIQKDFSDKYGWMKPGKSGVKIPSPYQSNRSQNLKTLKNTDSDAMKLEAWLAEENSYSKDPVYYRLNKFSPEAPVVNLNQTKVPYRPPLKETLPIPEDENSNKIINLMEYLKSRGNK